MLCQAITTELQWPSTLVLKKVCTSWTNVPLYFVLHYIYVFAFVHNAHCDCGYILVSSTNHHTLLLLQVPLYTPMVIDDWQSNILLNMQSHQGPNKMIYHYGYWS